MDSTNLHVSHLVFALVAIVFVVVAAMPGHTSPVVVAGPATPTPAKSGAPPAATLRAAPRLEAQPDAAPSTAVYQDPARLLSTTYPSSWEVSHQNIAFPASLW